MKKGQTPEGVRPGIATADSNQKSDSATNDNDNNVSDHPSTANDQSRISAAIKPGNLPETISGRLALVFECERLSPQKSRLLHYIAENPGAFTHVIGRECAVGFPPNRLGELNKEVLWRYGLLLHCHAPEKWLTNRYGAESFVHQWRLVLCPVGRRGAA